MHLARAPSSITIVSPPPGVSSASRVPPIASTNPFDSARPRPTPAVLSVSPSRWNGTNTSSRRSAGNARARVDDAQLHAVAEFAGRDDRRLSRRGSSAARWSSRLTSARCSSTASACDRRDRRRVPARPRPAPARSSSRAPPTTSSSATGARLTPSTPGLQPADVQQVGDQRRRARPRLSSAVSSSSARSAALSSTSPERSDVTAAVAAASGRRRSCPTAASRALRSRSASASGFASAASLGEPALHERGLELRHERAEDPAVGRLQLAAAQIDAGVLAERDRRLLVGVVGGVRIGGRTRSPRPPAQHDARHPERLAQSRRPAPARASAPCSTLPATATSTSASAEARAAIRARRAAWSTTRLTSAATTRKITSASRCSGFRDGDRVQRIDEEEVEQQPGRGGAEQRGPDPADQRDDHDEQLVHRAHRS